MKSATSFRTRKSLHQKALVLFDREDYSRAAQALERTRMRHGNHVGLLSDLCATYYRMREFSKWESALEQLETEFTAARPHLSDLSRLRTSLVIGKYLEERGLCGKAIELYRKEALEAAKLGSWHQKRVFDLQILRVKAMLRDLRGLGTLYKSLASLDPRELRYDEQVELEHGLILAELDLLGIRHGLARLNSLSKRITLLDYDRRLIAFDVAEALLLRGARAELSEIAPDLGSPEDIFEVAIARLAMSAGQTLDLNQFHQAMREMPLAYSLRLLQIHLAPGIVTHESGELESRLVLLLDSLDAPSRQIWSRRIGSPARTGSVEIVMNREKLTVECGGKTLHLARAATSFRLLEKLVAQKSLDFERLSLELWGGSYNSSYYHRIRMLASRLNQKLSELVGHDQILIVTGDSLRLSSELRVRLS